jgi:hypothetical protein
VLCIVVHTKKGTFFEESMNVVICMRTTQDF